MRKAILCHDGIEVSKRAGFNYGGYGKSHFPNVQVCSTTLVDLTGPDSKLFFIIIGLPDQSFHKLASE